MLWFGLCISALKVLFKWSLVTPPPLLCGRSDCGFWEFRWYTSVININVQIVVCSSLYGLSYVWLVTAEHPDI